MKTALIAGGTGLTGGELIVQLLSDSNYQKVISLVRHSSGIINNKLVEIIVDFEKLSESLEKTGQVDEVFCCLGSTIKKAGSQEKFRKVDYQYPVELAKWSQNQGVKHFLCISALGANAASGVFYNRVKGEMERDVAKFNIPSITFFRPSLLIGNRKESRPMERFAMVMMQMFSFLFIGKLKKYKAIDIKKVAQAMIKAALKSKEGVEVIESGEMTD